jgi:hypothetical protein
MQPGPHTMLRPLRESAVRGGPAQPEHRRGQYPPGTPGLNHVHHRREHRPVISTAPAATLRAPCGSWQKRFNDFPQVVGCPRANHAIDHSSEILPHHPLSN